MRKKIREYIKKVYFTKTARLWFVSYISILLVPVIFISLSYTCIRSALETQNSENHIRSLEISGDFLDNTLESIVKSTADLANNPYILDLAMRSDHFSLELQYDLINFNDIWNSYLLYDEYISNKCIYFANSNSVYTGKNIVSPQFYHSAYYQTSPEISAEILKEKVFANNSPGFVCIEAQAKPHLFYLYPTYKHGGNSILYNVIIELDYAKLLSTGRKHNEVVFMFTEDTDSIFAQNLSPELLSHIKALPNVYSSPEYASDNKTDYIIHRIRSGINNFGYGSVVQKSIYFNELYTIRIYMTLFCILSILLGLIIIAILVNRNNDALGNLISTINPKGGDVLYKKNTYQYINHLIKDILSEKEDYHTRLYQQNDILKDNILLNLLHGNKNEKFSAEYQLNMIGIDTDKDLYFTVMLGSADLSEMFFETSTDISPEEKTQLSLLIISNILKETLGKFYSCETVANNNFIVAVVTLANSQFAEFKENITEILDISFKQIKQEFNFDVVAAVSDVHTSINQLNTAYNESVLSMEYAFSTQQNILFYHDINFDNTDSAPSLLQDAEKQIIECLANKEYKRCKVLIENLIYDFQSNKNVSLPFARMYAFDLLKTFFNNLPSSVTDYSTGFTLNIEMNSIMNDCDTVSRVMLKLMMIINKYIDNLEPELSAETSNSKLYLQIKEYINLHYSNPSLSVQVLADAFDINPSYLSTRFKAELGIAISDYITQVRIDAAKQLLSTTNITNIDIAHQVGYSTPRTFLRAFQRVEGITPKEYRNISTKNVDIT